MNYKVEFNCLINLTPQGIKDSKRTKVQNFSDGLNLELQHDIQGFELTNLGALVHKAKLMEEVMDKIKVQKYWQKAILGKRLFGPYRSKKFKVESSLGSSNKPTLEKSQNQGQDNKTSGFPEHVSLMVNLETRLL